MSALQFFRSEDNRPYSTEELEKLFYKGDADGSKHLDPDEFQVLLKARGADVDIESVNTWFNAVDKNEDGRVSLHELLEYISHDAQQNFYDGPKRSKASMMGIAEGVEIDAQAKVNTEGVGEMFTNVDEAKEKCSDALLLQHASGMSFEMVKHLFLDLDEDNSGKISKAELYLLAPVLGEDWSDEDIDAIVQAADKNGDGEIDFDEFYMWFLKNVKMDSSASMKKRERALELEKYNDLDPRLLQLLDETCHDIMQEAPERPAETELNQFGEGRFLREHLVSCYLQARIWKGSEEFCKACLFHAIYEPGFQFRVVELQTARPFLRYILGEHAEWLLYNFIGASRSIFNPDGLYHADRDPGSWNQVDFATGEAQTMAAEKRRDLARLEFTNNYDKMHLHDEVDAVKSLWLYCQHMNIYDLLLDGQKEIVDRYAARGKSATCEEVAQWHEKRFKGATVTPVWQRHIAMFREGGRYCELEKQGTLFNVVSA